MLKLVRNHKELAACIEAFTWWANRFGEKQDAETFRAYCSQYRYGLVNGMEVAAFARF